MPSRIIDADGNELRVQRVGEDDPELTAAYLADLNLAGGPQYVTQDDLQVVGDKIDALLSALRASGQMASSP